MIINIYSFDYIDYNPMLLSVNGATLLTVYEQQLNLIFIETSGSCSPHKKGRNCLTKCYFTCQKWYHIVISLITDNEMHRQNSKSSRSEAFLGKSVLKICSKFTGERPWRSVISIKLQSNFIEITHFGMGVPL